MQRNYKTTDMEMLMIAATIVENAISNKAYLQTKKSAWAGSLFNDLKTKVDTACHDHFSADNGGDLQQAVGLFRDIHKKALKDLFIFKMQLTEDLKDDEQKLEQILTLLGFTAYYADAHDRDKKALVDLLARFRANASPELRNELMKKGISRNLISGLIEYDKAFKKAGIRPGNYKGIDKGVPVKAIKKLNEIHSSVIHLCKTAITFYKGDEQAREKFNFKAVAKWLNIKRLSNPSQLKAA
jgi:hypothetical protein